MFDVLDLEDCCQKAALEDVTFASDDELLSAVKGLARARAGLDAAEAHTLAELESRGVCDRDLGVGTAAWAAAETGASRAACRARIRLGRRLKKLPVVDQALSQGRISVEHARALADAVANLRVGHLIADLEGELVEAAQHCPFEIWKRDLAVLVELLDQDGNDPTRDLDRNKLHASLVGDARLMISGELVGEHALVVAKALNAKADELFRRYRDDHDRTEDVAIPPRSTLLALALAELCRAGLATDPAATRAPHPDVTLVIRTRETGAEHDDDESDEPGWSDDHPDRDDDDRYDRRRYDRRDWFGRDDQRPGLFTVDGDRLTTLERYEHLLCDAHISTLIVDSLGVPLDLGQSVRLATPAQRRALAVRDGGCVFPGCDAPVSWCDAHHVDWYEHGGSTDIANLALLCRRHHGVSHRRGWTITTTPDQRFTWVTPSGQVLHSQRHLGRPPPGS